MRIGHFIPKHLITVVLHKELRFYQKLFSARYISIKIRCKERMLYHAVMLPDATHLFVGVYVCVCVK